MRTGTSWIVAPFFAALAAVVHIGPSQAGIIDYLVDQATTPGAVPQCGHPDILAEIRERFATQAVRVHKRDHLFIREFSHVRERAFRVNDPSPQARRYCVTRAHLNDGHRPTLYYFIEQDLGFVGRRFNLEFCMIGYDPWRVYDGRCRTAREW